MTIQYDILFTIHSLLKRYFNRLYIECTFLLTLLTIRTPFTNEYYHVFVTPQRYMIHSLRCQIQERSYWKKCNTFKVQVAVKIVLQPQSMLNSRLTRNRSAGKPLAQCYPPRSNATNLCMCYLIHIILMIIDTQVNRRPGFWRASL